MPMMGVRRPSRLVSRNEREREEKRGDGVTLGRRGNGRRGVRAGEVEGGKGVSSGCWAMGVRIWYRSQVAGQI